MPKTIGPYSSYLWLDHVILCTRAMEKNNQREIRIQFLEEIDSDLFLQVTVEFKNLGFWVKNGNPNSQTLKILLIPSS